jgi:hypothetical protein
LQTRISNEGFDSPDCLPLAKLYCTRHGMLSVQQA